MTQFFVLLCGAIGLSFVALVGRNGLAGNGPALPILLAISLALVFGVVELLRMIGRTEQLRRALRGLAGSESLELDDAPESLRRVLEASLAGRAWPLPSAVFTPYLIGVMVMLGLLGTFFGLVQTLGGAREALVATAEIGALRQALLSPMRGLDQAFTTSLAGIGASASLGLAAVLGRRRERLLFTEVEHLIATRLADQTQAARQLAAMDAMVRHADGLPRAAEAIEQAVVGLDALRDSQAETQAQLGKALEQAIDDAGGKLGQGVEQVTEGFTRALEPLGADLATRLGQAFEGHVAELSRRIEADLGARQRQHEETAAAFEKALQHRLDQVTERVAELVEQSAEAEQHRLEHSGETLDKVSEALAALQQQTGELWGKQREALSEQMQQLESLAEQQQQARDAHGAELISQQAAEVQKVLAALADHEQALASRRGELSSELASHVETIQAQLAAQAEAMEQRGRDATGELGSQAERFDARLAEQIEAMDRRALALTEQLGNHVEQIDTRLADQAAAMDQRGLSVAEQLGTHVERFDARLAEQVAQLDARASEVASRLADHLEQLATQAAERDQTQREREEATLERQQQHLLELGESLRHSTAELGQGLAAEVDRLEEIAGERQRAQAEQTQAIDALLVGHLERLSGEHGRQLEQLTAAASSAPEAAAKLLERAGEQQDRLHAQDRARGAQLDALVEALSSTGQALRDGVEVQASSVQELLEGLQRDRTHFEQHAAERLGELLGGFGENLEAQRQQAEALEQRLSESRGQQAERFEASLREAAATQGEQWQQAASTLVEATGLLRAGSGELGSVAQLFGDAVDSYREASATWLDTLTRFEAALSQATGSGQEALALYLDQTREAVDSSLQFQQELYRELRALREEARA